MDDRVSDKELIESRKQEMENMLPGLMTYVTLRNGNKVAVYSPTRTAYFNKKKEDKNNG